MGNIQNLVCQENSCFDNNYEFEWISEQSWFIDTQSHSNKNNYIIEKGLVKLLSKEKCIYFLSKYIQIFYVNQKNQLIEIKQHEEKQKNKFSYQLLFNFQYLDYLIINETYDFH